MTLKNKFVYLNSIVFLSWPIASVISCSSSQSTPEHYDSYIKLKDILSKKNTSLFSELKKYKDLKNIRNIENKSLNDFRKEINETFSISAELLNDKTFNLDDYTKHISSITISPIIKTKNVKIIVFFGSSYNDSEIISQTLENALNVDFFYAHEITINKQEISYDKKIEKKDFDELVKNDEGKNKLISLAFQSSNLNDLLNIADFTYTNNSIKLRIKKDKLNEGYIFKIQENYYPEISSSILVK